MIRECLTVTLLAGWMGTIANASQPKVSGSESLAVVLKRNAEHVFAMANKNHDQGLDQAERVDAEARMKKTFSHMAEEHVLAGPRTPLQVDDSQQVNPALMTEAEFVQHFQAQAAQYDAEVRSRRLGKVNPAATPHQVAQHFGGSHGSSEKSSGDKSDKGDKPDKEDSSEPDKDDSKSQKSNGQQGNFQAQNGGAAMNPSNGFRPFATHTATRLERRVNPSSRDPIAPRIFQSERLHVRRRRRIRWRRIRWWWIRWWRIR